MRTAHRQQKTEGLAPELSPLSEKDYALADSADQIADLVLTGLL